MNLWGAFQVKRKLITHARFFHIWHSRLEQAANFSWLGLFPGTLRLSSHCSPQAHQGQPYRLPDCIGLFAKVVRVVTMVNAFLNVLEETWVWIAKRMRRLLRKNV